MNTNDVSRQTGRVLSDEAMEQIAAVKGKGQELLDLVDSLGQSREAALAKTKIEEAVMWAVKHITR